MSTVQYGEYIMTDGVVSKVSGLKFEIPELPDGLRIPDPPQSPKMTPMEHHREVENVAQMNAIREYYYQKNARRQYNMLRRLYYIQEVRRTFSRWGDYFIRLFSSRQKDSGSRN